MLRRPGFYLTLLLLLVIGVIYVLWLDHRISGKFSSDNRWALPARVYAAAVELYAGQPISQWQIIRTVQAAGYQAAGAVLHPGEYRSTKRRLDIYLRKFAYPDRQRPQQRIRIAFADNRIHRITNLDSGADEPIMQLEPELIGKIYPDSYEDRVLLKYEDIPQPLLQGLLTIEDRQFFTHPGINLRGILRAFLVNIKSGTITQGGSTLTQQLVKNYFLTQERNIWRKINEVIMALLLERRYSKQQILTAYCNVIFLGQQGRKSIHGFGTAAEYYFGRPLGELEIEQLALLIGMVKGASFYNPRRQPERAKRRRDLVLDEMLQAGDLSAPVARRAKSRGLGIADKPGWHYARYPAFVQLLKQQLLRDYKLQDLRSEGLQIHTTLDSRLQVLARNKTTTTLDGFEPQAGPEGKQLQSASVFVHNSSGAVLALVGGRNPDIPGFNRATEAQRQIGSLIKPFIYYAALQQDAALSLTDKVQDTDIRIKQQDGSVWQPQNYDRKNHGEVSLIEAMAFSYNKASVRLGRRTGIRPLIRTLQDLGVERHINEYDSLLLGALNLSPLQVAQFYQAVANGGFLVPLNSITEVLDRDGKPLQRYTIQLGQSLQPEINFLINYLMVQAVEYGTAQKLADYPGLRGRTLAGKTGTSNDLRDSWFAGFGDDVSGVTWVGRDDNSTTGLSGATGALVVWAQIMSAYGVKPLGLSAPPDIKWARNIRLRLRGRCTNLGRVPYSGKTVPRSDLECR